MMPTLQPVPGRSAAGASLRCLNAITLMRTYREGRVFQRISRSIPCTAHGPASDLADLVLDSPASPGALVHGGLMHLEQEGGRRRTRGQSLLLANPGERLEVLARPVDVYAAGDAVPLFVRCLGAALRTAHGHHPGQAFFQRSSRRASY